MVEEMVVVEVVEKASSSELEVAEAKAGAEAEMEEDLERIESELAVVIVERVVVKRLG